MALLMDMGSYADIPHYYFEDVLHCTDFYEIIFFEQGNGWLYLDHQRIEIASQTVVFISPYQKRRWQIDKHKIACHFLFFQDTFLSNFFADKLFAFRLQYFYNKSQPLFIKTEHSVFANLMMLLAEIRSEIINYQADSQHLIRALLYFVLIKLNRAFSVTNSLPLETQGNHIAFSFKQMLETRIKENHDVNFYANLLKISRITLNKAIKEQFGITVSTMIEQRMLFEIKNELIFSSKNIAEIAHELHFSEPNHLTRFFKNATNQTPQAYRLAYQNGRYFI